MGGGKELESSRLLQWSNGQVALEGVVDRWWWFSLQGPINAQMLAQRQREILSQHLRQRQMQQQQQQVQQRTLMMRGQGLSMTPSMVATGGIPATMSNPRIPQANAQQFPFPPNYGTGSTPPCISAVLSPLCSPQCWVQAPLPQPIAWLPGNDGKRGGSGPLGVLKCDTVPATSLALVPRSLWAPLFFWAIAKVWCVYLHISIQINTYKCVCIQEHIYAYVLAWCFLNFD